MTFVLRLLGLHLTSLCREASFCEVMEVKCNTIVVKLVV